MSCMVSGDFGCKPQLEEAPGVNTVLSKNGNFVALIGAQRRSRCDAPTSSQNTGLESSTIHARIVNKVTFYLTFY